MISGRLSAACAFALSVNAPANAADIFGNFDGLFTNTFPGGTPYPTDTGYNGDVSVSTDLLPTVTTVNPYHLTTGSDGFTGIVQFVTNDSAGGNDSLRAFLIGAAS